MTDYTLEAALKYKALMLNTTTKKLLYMLIKNESYNGTKWAEITLSEFNIATGKSTAYISRTLNSLTEANLITTRKIRIGSSYVNQYIVNPME